MPRERGAGERTPGHLPSLYLCTRIEAKGSNEPKADLSKQHST